MPHLRQRLRHDDITSSTISSSIERNSNDNGINNRQSTSISGGVIGGQAFYDTNQNGINDDHLSSSNTQLPTNINIWLFTCNPNVPSINMGHYETNNSGGMYTFDKLDSGSYYLVVQKPKGYEFSSIWKDVNHQPPIQSSSLSSTTLSTMQAALKQSIAQQFSSSSSNTNTTLISNVEYSTINPEKGQTTCFTINDNEVNLNMHFGLYRISSNDDNDASLPSLQPSSSSEMGSDMSGDTSNVHTSYRPSDRPSYKSSYRPSVEPSNVPSYNPTIQIIDTEEPTQIVSSSPSISSYPTAVTSNTPSSVPTSSSSVSNRPERPSLAPSNRSSVRPSLIISNQPTNRPSHSYVPSLEGTTHDIEDTNNIPTPTLKPSIEGGDIDESSSLVVSDSPSSYPINIPSISLDSSLIVIDNSNIDNEETSNNNNNGIVIGGLIFGILSLLVITIELLIWYRRRRKRKIKEQDDNNINNDIVISTTTNNNNNEEPSPLSNESTIVHRGTSISAAAWHEVDYDIEQSNRTQDPSHRSEDVESKEEDTSKGDTSKDTNSSKDSWFSTTVQTLWNQHYRRRGSKEDEVSKKKKASSSRRREQNSDGDLTAVRVNLTSSFLRSGSKKRSESPTISNDEHIDKLEQEICTLTNIIEGLSKGSNEYMLLCSYLDKTIQELTIMKQDYTNNNTVVSRRGRSPPSRVHYSSSSRSGGISDSSSISSSGGGSSSFVSSTGSDSVDSVDWRQFMPKPGEQGLPDSVQDALVLVDEIQKESLSLALEDASGNHSITETNLVTSAKHEIQSLEHELNSLSKALETYSRDGKSWQLLHSYFEKVKEELDSVRNDINVLESSGEDLSSSVDSYLTNSGRNTPVDLNEATTSSNNNNLSLKDIVGIYNPNNADSLSTVHEGLDESTSDYEKSLPSLISSSESEQDQNLSLQDIESPVPSSSKEGSSIYTDSLDKVLLHEGVDDGTAQHTETNPYVVSPGSSEEATVGSGNSDDSETRRIFGERRRGEKSARVQSQSPKRKNLLWSSGKDDQFSVASLSIASSSGWSTCDDHSSSSDVSET